MESPIHAKLTQSLLREIASGYYGTGARFLTVRQIAEKWTVSPATVKKSLEKLSGEYLKSRPKSGYYLRCEARRRALLQLKHQEVPWLGTRREDQACSGSDAVETHKGFLVAFIDYGRVGMWDLRAELSESQWSSIRRSYEGFRRACESMGFGCKMIGLDSTLESQKQALHHLKDSACAGVAIFRRNGATSIRSIVRSLRITGIPVVTVFDDCHGLEVTSVNWNNVAIGFAAIKRLVQLGHQRIIVLGTRSKINYHEDRIAGALMAAEQLSEQFPVRLRVMRVNYEAPSIQSLEDELLSKFDKPTAIFSTTSQAVVNMKPVFERMQLRIPQDLSLLVCSGKTLLPGFSFPVDTMRIDFGHIGETAARTLVDIRNNRLDSKIVLVKAKYASGQSIATLG